MGVLCMLHCGFVQQKASFFYAAPADAFLQLSLFLPSSCLVCSCMAAPPAGPPPHSSFFVLAVLRACAAVPRGFGLLQLSGTHQHLGVVSARRFAFMARICHCPSALTSCLRLISLCGRPTQAPCFHFFISAANDINASL